MKQIRRRLWCVVFVLGLVLLALPGVAWAAPANSSTLVDEPIQPTFAVPGVFSLRLGDRLSTAEVDLPTINATATVSGLRLGSSPDWDTISITQREPKVVQSGTISGLQATVQGPSTGYSTSVSANVDVHPSEAFRATGTFAVSYDGLARSFGVGVQEGNLAMTAGPAKIAIVGANTGGGTLAIDKMGIAVPAFGAAVILDGYTVDHGRADWNNLSVVIPGAKIGDVAAISNVQADIPGPSALATRPVNVSANVALNVGQVVQVEGQLGTTVDPVTRQSTVTFNNGNVAVGVPAWNLAFLGVNTGSQGVTIDHIALQAQPINMTVEMSGVAVGGTSGFSFEQARLTQAGDGQGNGGFEMLMTRTPQGYVVQTVSLIPVATSR